MEQELKCNQVGMLSGGKWDKLHDISRRVYGVDGLSSTLYTAGGGNTEVKIAEPIIYDDTYGYETEPRQYPKTCPTLRADRQGLKVIEPIIYDDYNGRVKADQQCIGTLTTNCGQEAKGNGVKIIEQIAYYEQNGYIRQDGCCGTLTTDGSTPKHNNRVVEQSRGGGMRCVTTSAFANLPRVKLTGLWALITPTSTTLPTVAYRRQTTADG